MFGSKWLRKIALVLGGLVFVFLAFVVLKVIANFPGGMRSVSNVVDYDKRLVGYAQPAAPIIVKLNEYMAKNGAPPSSYDALVAVLPDSRISPDALSIDGWRYNANDSGFSLRMNLGWDPSLTYSSDGQIEQWIYDPGDGTPSTTLQLLN